MTQGAGWKSLGTGDARRGKRASHAGQDDAAAQKGVVLGHVLLLLFHTNIGLAHHIGPAGDLSAHKGGEAFRA